jgi:hypothetical protein
MINLSRQKNKMYATASPAVTHRLLRDKNQKQAHASKQQCLEPYVNK